MAKKTTQEEEKIINPYEDIESFNDFDPNRNANLFGEERLIDVRELQVGYGSQVFRVDRQGIWLGSARFADAAFSVDMAGNVIAKSFATGDVGQHIEIDSANTNQIRFYDGTTLFGLLEVDYDSINDIGYINLLAQDLGAGLSIDVGVGASSFSSSRMFSNGGGFYTNGNASSGFNSIYGKTGDPSAGTGYLGVHTIATVDYIMTDLLPVGDPGVSGALYVDGSGFVKQSP